jgi:hypothetical protein
MVYGGKKRVGNVCHVLSFFTFVWGRVGGAMCIHSGMFIRWVIWFKVSVSPIGDVL